MEQELDPHLIDGIRLGEDRAFKIVMDRLHPKLASMAYQLLFHYENVQDAVAHGFLKLFEHRKEMESISNVEGFLYKTVRHKCLDLLKMNSTRQRKLQDLPLGWAATVDQAGKEHEADHKVIMADLVYLLHAAMEKMPEHVQLAFQWRTLEKMPMAEVSLRLGVTEKTALGYVNQAKKIICGDLVSNGVSMYLILWLLKTLE
jgi:RNA polymerase sigma-70 factor (ECF subfamily)